MASYWTRKDDQSGELSTVKPWEEVLGHGDRTVPHMRYHVVCGVIEQNGRFLCMQKGQTKYVYTTGKWEFPGGKIEPGESPEEALKREIREELSTEISVDKFLCTVEYDYPKFHLTMHCFWCSLQSDALHLNEHEAAKWLSLDQIDSVKWLPADKIVIEQIK